MSEKELLNHWLINMYSGLKKMNNEIKDLENDKEFFEKLNDLQLKKLDDWLEADNIEEDLDDELKYWRNFAERMPDEDEKKLTRLKKQRDAAIYIINKIEQELRG